MLKKTADLVAGGTPYDDDNDNYDDGDGNNDTNADAVDIISKDLAGRK